MVCIMYDEAMCKFIHDICDEVCAQFMHEIYDVLCAQIHDVLCALLYVMPKSCFPISWD